jgi:spore germination cell wall hydrolase CwlJ-like protein
MKAWLQKIYDANLRDFGHLDPAQVMGTTIFAEARGEIREGQIAVGSVILERVDHRDWDGHTIKEVCLWPVQFSCYLPRDPNRPDLVAIAKDFSVAIGRLTALKNCYDIAQGLISGNIARNVEATEYINPKAVKDLPHWYYVMKRVATIGNHEFFI